MINKKLNVGDYIFTASGRLCRITKINKTTYSFEDITPDGYFGRDNVSFNGIKKGFYEEIEFFECDDPTAKALEIAMKKYSVAHNLEKEAAKALAETKELLGKAKYFLNQINDIEELEVEEYE